MCEETNTPEEVTETAVEASKPEDLGAVNISDDVIAVVVGMTLSEIRGICPSGSNFGNIAEMFSGKRNMGKGVKVSVDGQNVSLDLHIIVEYGIKIPDVAWQAQEKVKEAVESITGLCVDKVNVHVEGVSVVKETKETSKISVSDSAAEAEDEAEGENENENEKEMEELKKVDDMPSDAE